MRFPKGTRALLLGVALLAIAGVCSAQTFVSGDIPSDGPLPSAFTNVDTFIKNHMAANQISAMTVAAMWNGRVVFERGYGWRDWHNGDLTPVQNDDLARVASVTKPLVGAAIYNLISTGVISGSDKVFDYGQATPGTGLLPAGTYAPYNGVLGDSNLVRINVNNLRRHRGGWDSKTSYGIQWWQNAFDPQFNAINIANAMSISSPPGPVNTVNFMLTQPLRYVPGTASGLCDGTFCYSNFGFMLLGLIIEQATGDTPVQYLRDNFLPLWGGAPGDLVAGRSFQEDQEPEEPHYYVDGVANDLNVFYPARGPALVEEPYGGWEQEVFLGHGNIVTNTTMMLNFSDRYFTWYDASGTLLGQGAVDIGTPLSLLSPWGGSIAHSGSLPGTNAWHEQDGNGLRIAVICNRRVSGSDDSFVADVADSIRNTVNAVGFVAPTLYATDNWVDFGAGGGGTGTFASPMSTVDAILPTVQDRGRVKFKPGDTNWTGTITTPVRLDAPLGTVRIGQQ
jgi:CubicO group peptidase (beta-lactamase class C family)